MVMNCKIEIHSSLVISLKANVFLICLKVSSALKPSPTAREIKNCTKTSNVRTIGIRGSILFCFTASFKAETSINSNECVGTKYILEVSKGECPLRPARCKKRATPFAEPI